VLAALALVAVALVAVAAVGADAAPAKAVSPVEQYTALAKEYVAKAQKLAEEVSAQAQETVSYDVPHLPLMSPPLPAAVRSPDENKTTPPPLFKRKTKQRQAETYIKQANEYVQDAIKQITAKKTEL